MLTKCDMRDQRLLMTVTLSEADRKVKRRPGALAVFIGVAIVATVIDVVTSLILSRYRLNPYVATVIALLPLPGNLTLIYLVLRAVRKLDEFKQRIHFEAVVFAFLATGVAVFVYGFLHQARLVGPSNAALVWLFMIVCYGLGYFFALRQYK